jgi:hypothetical protein
MPFTPEEKVALQEAGFTISQIATMEQHNIISPIGLGEEDMHEWWETYRALAESP